MEFSGVNMIVIVAIVIGLAVMIWQIITANQPSDTFDDDDSWQDDIDNTEESLDETEEFLRRMERLSKRNQDENDKK